MDKFKLENYDYELPQELIAQVPSPERDKSRLLVTDKKTGVIEHRLFENITEYLKPGDCLVLNDTRVIPARIYGRTKSGAAIELLLLSFKENYWEAIMGNSRRVKEGDTVLLDGNISALIKKKFGKTVAVYFSAGREEILKAFEKHGKIPLPPYIKEDDSAFHRERYQTVYARKDGATAAPTAGLHFTPALLNRIKTSGVYVEYITLHTGLGTFAPVTEPDIREHKIHNEEYEISPETSAAINTAKESGGRIIAVGTTSLRALESAYSQNKIKSGKSNTSIYIYPGYQFKAVDCLITNFHLPKTTLLALVYAFAGEKNAKKAYKSAIENKYRFFSYGDAMFIK
ncbi:MAG: tRNA preQ1(34) S-adenosylmethionine ribosyltransferase-isomerase QueA [Candidatus Goldbacteria bacterium]|nr:tRNA preQ1(34) S-adenosylmethionine ribosyltransferase-isomerase QueA [Candidatus Goldiibacteriota bacterium]